MRKTGDFLAHFWGDEGGAAAAEYALLLAIIAAGLAVAAGTLGSAISNADIGFCDFERVGQRCNLHRRRTCLLNAVMLNGQ
jgi:Flp pilus assembly pilin Flp